MTKNTTRKGLALGAAAALVAAGFVGASPAYAAFATLDASFGTSGATQNGLLGQTFNLAATSDTTASAKFYVTGATAAELTVTKQYVTTLSAIDAGTYTAAAEADKTVGTDKAVTIAPATWTAANYAQMNFSLTGVTTTRTITITPFLDTVVADGLITSGEVSGTPVTLTFHKASEVTATTTLDAIAVGDASVGASVVLDKGINMASIGGGVSVYFAENGADFGTDQLATYVKADAAFTATSDATPSAGKVYSAQARVGGATAADNSGSAALSNVGTGTIDELSDLIAEKGTSYVATGVNTSVDVIRAGSGTFTVSTSGSTALSADAVGADVTFVIEETGANSIDAAASITAGGKTLSGASALAQKITVVVKTDADGEAALAISYTGIKDANDFNVTISASDTDGAATVAAGGSLTEKFTGQNSVATAVVDVNQLGGAAGNDPVLATTVGGPIGISYKVVDQFGQTPVGTFRVKVATDAPGGALNSTLAVTSGSATLSVTDNSDAVTDVYTTGASATVEKYDAVAATWGAVTGPTAATKISLVSALPAAARVTIEEALNSTATTNLKALSAAALATVDARLSQDSAALPAIIAQTISGVVYGSNGAPQKGATVTLSAAGVMFVTDSQTAADAHYSLGSTTIRTDANGAWGDVAVLSTVAGKHTVTVTSGSATDTEDVFFAAAAHDAGATVTVSAPASVLKGSTLQISAVVTDKFGNPVNTSASLDVATVAITYTGPGLVVGTLPTETDADGMVKFGVLLGTNDSGTFVATVTYLSAGASTAAADKISSSASVVIGTAGNLGTLATWTSNQNDGTVKMYAKNVVGAGKVQFMLNGEEIAWVRAASTSDSKLRLAGAEGAAYLVRTVDLVEGQKNVLEIYVDGVRTTRSAYTY